MFSYCLFVSSATQTTQPIFTKFREKVAHGPTDFSANPHLDPESGIFQLNFYH